MVMYDWFKRTLGIFRRDKLTVYPRDEGNSRIVMRLRMQSYMFNLLRPRKSMNIRYLIIKIIPSMSCEDTNSGLSLNDI
jgi:hypothetical protein